MSKTLRFCVLFALGLFACFCISCNKEIDPDSPMPLDYALQIIPPIDEVIPADLIQAMSPYLYFGDTPPALTRITEDSLSLGFGGVKPELIYYSSTDSSSQYSQTALMYDYPVPRNNKDYFLFHDQHRGIIQLDYKMSYYDTVFNINNDSIQVIIYEMAHTEAVYVMGNSSYFTAYYMPHKSDSKVYCTPNPYFNVPNVDLYGSHEAAILCGEITNNGIRNAHLGFKVTDYDDPRGIGTLAPNIGDVLIYHYDFLPFTYWDPYKVY